MMDRAGREVFSALEPDPWEAAAGLGQARQPFNRRGSLWFSGWRLMWCTAWEPGRAGLSPCCATPLQAPPSQGLNFPTLLGSESTMDGKAVNLPGAKQMLSIHTVIMIVSAKQRELVIWVP